MDLSAAGFKKDTIIPAEVPSIGQMLKLERINQQKTLSAVAEYLKIREVFLNAIENDQFDVLPGGIYTLGFIRSYANYLKLDDDAIVEILKEETSFGPASLTVVGDEQHFMTNRFVPSSMVLIGSVIFIICAIGAYFYLSEDDISTNWPSSPAPAPAVEVNSQTSTKSVDIPALPDVSDVSQATSSGEEPTL